MKKILVIGLISSFFSAGAFAAACTATAAAAGAATSTTTVGSATAPVTGEICVCDGNVAGKQPVNGGPTNTVNTPLFVQTGFDVQCSNNTIVSYNEVSGVAFAVGSASRKGNRAFKGSSAGGGIAEAGVCPPAGCGNADVTTANAAATTDSSS
jgi:hypothetical protein